MVGVSKRILSVKHLAPKIMAVNYCGRQLARRLAWAAPAYHKKEGATPRPGACKLSLQYDRSLMSALACGLGREI